MKKIMINKKKVNEGKKVIISHNDLDGVLSAILFAKAFPKAEVKLVSAGKEADETILSALKVYDTILVADISCYEDTSKKVEEFVNSGKTFVLLDHHITADYLNQYSWAIVKPDKDNDSLVGEYKGIKLDKECGAALVYHWLRYNGLISYDEDLWNLVAITSILDTWMFNSIPELKPMTNEFQKWNQLFYFLGPEEFFVNPIFKWTKKEEFTIEIVNKFEDNLIESIAATAKEVVFEGIPAICCHTSGKLNIPKLLLKLLDEHPEHDLFVFIGSDNVSLRSRKDSNINVAEMAKSRNGGGHPNASGFSIKTEVIEECYKNIFKV